MMPFPAFAPAPSLFLFQQLHSFLMSERIQKEGADASAGQCHTLWQSPPPPLSATAYYMYIDIDTFRLQTYVYMKIERPHAVYISQRSTFPVSSLWRSTYIYK